MDKALILNKLDMLVKLCEETEPEESGEKNSLFSTQFVTAMEMLKKVEDWHDGKNVQDLEGKEELISMMKCANRIWKFRNKIKNGELDGDNVDLMEVHETIEEYLVQSAKIAAIKYYREVMDTHFDTKVSLKEAKDFVDAIQNDMIRRKII